MPEEQGLTSLLCDYAANLQYEDLPAEVIATAKRLVLDSLGAALAGTTMGDGCRETLAVVRGIGRRSREQRVGNGRAHLGGDGILGQRSNGACAELRRHRSAWRTPRRLRSDSPTSYG